MTTRPTALLTLVVALGCASHGSTDSSAPEPDPVTRVTISSGAGTIGAAQIHNDPNAATRTFPLPVDSVWAALPRAYAVLDVEGTGVAPADGVYGFRNQRPRRLDGKRLSTYLDCGMGPSGARADEYQVTLTVLSSVRAAQEPNSAILETSVEANARPRAVAGNAITCQSTGMLEARIAELVVWALASGGRAR